jgi:flagellar basal body P-ring protein FlgI
MYKKTPAVIRRENTPAAASDAQSLDIVVLCLGEIESVAGGTAINSPIEKR